MEGKICVHTSSIGQGVLVNTKIRMMMRINRALCFIAGPQEAKNAGGLCHVDGKILCTHLFSHGNKGIAPQHIAISRPADFIELVMTVIEGIRAKEIGQICRTTIGFDKIL